jgi:hypothetical protein
MCRNIKTLFNFDPPVNDEEIRAASLQFVRKITGFNKPSKANEASFLGAVDEIAGISRPDSSTPSKPPHRRRIERKKRLRRKLAPRNGSASDRDAVDAYPCCVLLVLFLGDRLPPDTVNSIA